MPTTFKYCLANQILGVGWRTDSITNTKSWDEYFSKASTIHENLQVCKYINENVSKNDLVWTRDAEGEYYLAKVKSGWEYWTCQESIEKGIDIANIFRVEIFKVPIDMVPGKVIACFRSTRSIQKIADEKTLEYSKYLWNKLTNTETYSINRPAFSDIFMMLDDEETEDLVFLFLQSKGWFVVPNSRKADTMSFEYLVVNPKTEEKALTQVKTGQVAINKDDYAKFPETIFLFQSNDLYFGNGASNVIPIPRVELLEFMKNSLRWLPKVFQTKAELISAEGK